MNGIIYKATNKINGKVYIGQSHNFKRRVKQHIYHAIVMNETYPFYNAIRKYGEENFEWTILCECNLQDELNFVENSFILYYGGIEGDQNYNLREASSNGRHSELTKEKMSKSQIGCKNHAFGKELSDEHKKRISVALKGKNSYWYGKHHSNETKTKLRIFNLNKKLSEETKNKIKKNNKMFVNIEIDDLAQQIKNNENILIRELSAIFNITRRTMTEKIKKFGFKGFKDFKQCILNIR